MAKKTLEQLIQWVEAFEDATIESRQLAERDRDYYDGKQWTPEEVAELNRRNQPVLTINRIAPKVDFMLGYERRSRNDPKAFPRTPMHEDAADAATDAIRYVCDASDWPQERSKAFEYMSIEGVCGADVRVESSGDGNVDICIEHIPWDRLIWDYRSRRDDFRDAKWLGQIAWFDLEDALEMFGKFRGAKTVLEQAVSQSFGGKLNSTFDDKPRYSLWSDTSKDRPRVKVAQLYYRVGGKYSPWYVSIFCRPGFISEPKLSPYLDDKGIPSCPIVLQSAKVDRDNQRYGVARILISMQDEINHRRSKALHLLNVRQTLSEDGAVNDIPHMKRELARPDGHIIVTPGMRFEVLPTNDLAAGQLNLLTEAKAEMDAMGANSALTGDDPRLQSGRAIQARQQGGTLELERIYDGFRSWQLRVYRAVWERIRQFWTEEKWVRVTDNEDNLRYVGLNRPVTMAEEMQRRGIQLPPIETLPLELQRELSQVISTENDVTNLDVDIILDEGADVVTIQQEQFEMLAKIPNMPADLLIEASSLRNKKQILERIKNGGATPEQQQQAAQQQQLQQQIQMQAISLDLAQKEADVQKTKAETAQIGSKIHSDASKTMLDEVRTARDLSEPRQAASNSP